MAILTREGGRSIKTGGRSDLSTIQGLADLARRSGFEKEVEKILEQPKLGVLQRLGRILTSFETGNALYQSRYEKKSFAKTYLSDVYGGLKSGITGRETLQTPKRTYKDILVEEGMNDRPGKLDAVDVVGLVADIITDPLTFFGGYAGRGIAKGAKVGIEAGKKVPGLGLVLKGVQEGYEELFKPFAKIEKLGEVGKGYRQMFNKFAKGTRAEMDDFLTEVSTKAKGVKGIEKAGARIGEAVETGVKTGDNFLDEVVDSLIQTQKMFTKKEFERGILKHQLPDYMHHMLTPEAQRYLTEGFDLAQFVKPIRVKLGAAKERKIAGIVKEINEEYFKKLGFNLFEEDAFKAFAKRGIDSIRAVNTHDFLERVGNQFGKKVEANFVDEVGVKWIESAVPQLKGIRVPEAIAKHLDETNKILTNDESTKALVRLFDRIQSYWKTSVTGYFPAFHTRNALGGVFNNWL